MPGPRNRPKKKKGNKKTLAGAQLPLVTRELLTHDAGGELIDTFNDPEPNTQPTSPHDTLITPSTPLVASDQAPDSSSELPSGINSYERPHYLRPQGHAGPKLASLFDFISSSFAEPPAPDDPACAPFVNAATELLLVLRSYLTPELALSIWYNKTRSRGRVCPSCQVFYKLGDVVPPPVDLGIPLPHSDLLNFSEQQISGICSLTCFTVATYNFVGGVNAWGKMERDLDNDTARSFDQPQFVVDDQGLGTLVRVTRLEDVGISHFLADQVKRPPGIPEELDLQ